MHHNLDKKITKKHIGTLLLLMRRHYSGLGYSLSGPPDQNLLMMSTYNFSLTLLCRSRDSGKGKIDFVDIASPSYKPEENMGLTYEQVTIE